MYILVTKFLEEFPHQIRVFIDAHGEAVPAEVKLQVVLLNFPDIPFPDHSPVGKKKSV